MRPFKRLKQRRKSRAFKLILAPVLRDSSQITNLNPGGKNLFKKYTMLELLDELDIIECFEYPGRDPRIGEVTKRQIELYVAMDIESPTSLH